MKIHEYQAKEILRKYGVPVPEGQMTDDLGEVEKICKKLPTKICVVKAQIHAGGRGKGGGVKVAKNIEEAKKYASDILGMQLITHQTGPQGQKVRKLLIEQGMNIEKEFYLGVTLDRASAKVTVIASTEGGMEIEKVAYDTPEKIIKTRVDSAFGLTEANFRKMLSGLGLSDKELQKKFKNFVKALYNVYMEMDCSLIEINPLVITREGDMFALDCKINFDENSLFRHPELEDLRDESEEDPLELEAASHHLNFIRLDGNVGCMVNGAGLAMATMDIIKYYGATPANFLDVGGTADAARVAKAFEIITGEPNVKAILVNIFGGIVRCDRVAQGIVDACKMIDLKVPLVVRLSGTNALEAREILKNSGVNVIAATGLQDAAQKVVAAIR